MHDICNDSRRRFKLMPSNRLLPYASCVPMRLYPPHMIVGFATGPPILALIIRLAWDAMFGIGVCVHSPGAPSFRGLTLQDYPGQGGYGGWLEPRCCPSYLLWLRASRHQLRGHSVCICRHGAGRSALQEREQASNQAALLARVPVDSSTNSRHRHHRI